MSVSGTNFGNAAADYRKFRAGFPESIFERLSDFGIGRRAQRIIDLGTGTGTLARGFARRGCDVVGIDPDVRMLEQAAQLDAEIGVQITYVEGTAEATGLDDGIADAVSAGQCWHWFDRPRALMEVERLLMPRGKLVIAHFDWLPLPGNVVSATEELIMQYNPDWHLGGGNGQYPQWLPDLKESGMKGIQTFSYDLDVPYTPEAWIGRIRASAGVAVLDSEAGKGFDDDLTRVLAEGFPVDLLAVPHRVFAIVCEKRN